jgi:hypothetical protein
VTGLDPAIGTAIVDGNALGALRPEKRIVTGIKIATGAFSGCIDVC